MAASVTSICNEALAAVGHERINSIDEGSEAARLCNDHYDAARDEVLESYDWNCAAARASLASSAGTPAWGWAYAYNLPADCLKVREINGELDFGERYKVEARQILTDVAPPLAIRYTRQLTDVSQMPPSLRTVIAYRLARKFAYPLTGKANLTGSIEQLYRMLRKDATRADAREGSADPAVADDWIASRL